MKVCSFKLIHQASARKSSLRFLADETLMPLCNWDFMILNFQNESVFSRSLAGSSESSDALHAPTRVTIMRDETIRHWKCAFCRSRAPQQAQGGWAPTTHVTSFHLPCFCGHRFTDSNAKVKRRVPDIAHNIPLLGIETYEGIAWYLLLCCETLIVKWSV